MLRLVNLEPDRIRILFNRQRAVAGIINLLSISKTIIHFYHSSLLCFTNSIRLCACESQMRVFDRSSCYFRWNKTSCSHHVTNMIEINFIRRKSSVHEKRHKRQNHATERSKKVGLFTLCMTYPAENSLIVTHTSFVDSVKANGLSS